MSWLKNLFKKDKSKDSKYKIEITADDYKLKNFFWDGNKLDTGDKFLESTIYDLLSKHLTKNFILFSHVSLKEIFSVKNYDKVYFYLSYLAIHHVDFLILDRKAGRPVCAIEVDGSYHKTDEKQIRSDMFKDSLFSLYDIPLVRIKLEEDLLNIQYYIERFRKDVFARPVYHYTWHNRMRRIENGPHGVFFSCPCCKRADGKSETVSINYLPEIFC